MNYGASKAHTVFCAKYDEVVKEASDEYFEKTCAKTEEKRSKN